MRVMSLWGNGRTAREQAGMATPSHRGDGQALCSPYGRAGPGLPSLWPHKTSSRFCSKVALKELNVTPRLRNAFETAYKAFGSRRLGRPMEVCRCKMCMSDEMERSILRTPLRELS